MEVVNKYIKDLVPYENNPRDNTEAVDYVAESISKFGFQVPIIVDNKNVIVAGHTRLLAAKKLKLKKVPCIVADDLTEEQIKAFRIIDNKVAENARWDYTKLSQEMAELGDLDWQALGFSDFELDLIDNRLLEVEESVAQVDESQYDQNNTVLDTKPKKAEPANKEPVKIKKIQCPCCGKLLNYNPSLVGGSK